MTYNLPNMNGVEIIVQLLHRTWGPDEQQLNLDYMTDFFSLRRMPGEPIDNYMHRAELVYRRCHSNCGFEPSSSGLAYLLIQQHRISNSDLLQLLTDFHGTLPSNPGELLHFKQKAKAHLKILHPAQFVRTRHLSEQHPETPTVKSFIVYGGFLSHDSHEQLIALEQEVSYLRTITGTVSAPFPPATPGRDASSHEGQPHSLFYK